MRSYWNTSKLIRLPIIYGCLQAATAELSRGGGDPPGMQSLK